MNATDHVEVLETVWIKMPDGARLAARLWLPHGSQDAPVPCILEYIPYRRRDKTRLRDEGMHPLFAASGYASIRVDMRGSGDSDGLMPDEYTAQEIQDGVDVIAWLADQPWCDGNVGMFGKSWGAYTSFQVAAKRPPALRAIAPVMGCDDRWREDIHFYGGCLAGDNFWWGSIMQCMNAAPPDPATVGADRWRVMWKDRLDNMTFWPAQWLEHQTHDEMWRHGSICENYDDIEIPVYFFGGWADLYRDTPFRIAEHLGGPTKVLMGPWAHVYPHDGIPGPSIDFIGECVRFWDHWLKGKDTGLMDEPRLRFWLQDGYPPAGTQHTRPGTWVEDPSWPSPNVADQTLWLNNATLGNVAQPTAEALAICTPQTFGSAGGDMCSFGMPGELPADCRIDAGGALVFRAGAAPADVDILGQPRVQLQVAADKPQGFVVALLIDEAPGGAQTLISRGFANLMHRNGDTGPQPVDPGVAMDITVPLHGVGYRLKAGHRIMVQIASAYWPVLWPSPEPVTLTLTAGTSALKLPVRHQTCEAAVPRPLAPPHTSDARPPATYIDEGSLERSTHMDLTTGTQTNRSFIKGAFLDPMGRLRLNDTGTVMGGMIDRVHEIHAADPLSARATMTQDCTFERDDWNVRIETWSQMTATETEFMLRATVKCWEGEALFHTVEWDHTIPRNGM